MIDAERDPNAPYWKGDFQVGDRVRVRLSGECRCCAKGTRPINHDGKHGRIRQIDWPFEGTPFGDLDVGGGHRHLVVFDRSAKPFGAYFAATELERLAPDA